jgi:hypothetical protein
MEDPSRRGPRSWPRDRPIRWGGVVGNLAWFAVGSAAAIVQFVLVVPVIVVGESPAGDGLGGFDGTGLALVWGAMTLFAAWSWVMGRWRVVLAPLVTVAALLVASSVVPS